MKTCLPHTCSGKGKLIIRFHCTPIRRTKIRNAANTKFWWAHGAEESAASLEDSLAVPYETKCTLKNISNIFLLSNTHILNLGICKYRIVNVAKIQIHIIIILIYFIIDIEKSSKHTCANWITFYKRWYVDLRSTFI